MKVATINGIRHYATPKGKIYPSITTILKYDPEKIKVLKAWRKRVGEKAAEKISQVARDRGENIHQLLENYLANNPSDLRTAKHKAQILFKQFIKHLKKINNIHLQETALYSDSLRVAGRVDLIAEYDGDLAIIDFKGSNKPKKKEWIDDYMMQATAYAVMYFERTGIMIKKVIIIIGTEQLEYQFKGADIFIENPKNYLGKLQNAIKLYYKTHTNPVSLDV
jgi:genome maintenance exonuclease 1